MNAPLTRRSLLGATAAVGAMVLPAIAEAGNPASVSTNPEAELLNLLDRWRAAQKAWEATIEPFDAALSRARAAYPPRPEALWWRGNDLGRFIGATATGKEPRPHNRMRLFYTFGDVEQMRAAPPATRWASVADDYPGPPPREIDPEGEARRQEIIAAYDGWKRAREAADDASGYTAAYQAARSAANTMNAAEDAVKLCQPRTVEGLVAKAAWVADLMSKDACDDDLGEVFARQVAAFGGVAS